MRKLGSKNKETTEEKEWEEYSGKLERLLKEIYWYTNDSAIDYTLTKLLSERPGS